MNEESKNSGNINYEEIRFSGDGEDFNEWLKIKWYEHIETLIGINKTLKTKPH
jgi:hypothetical protein